MEIQHSEKEKLISGKAVSQSILEEIHQEAQELKLSKNVTPSLRVLLVGNNPASASYVSRKEKIALQLGFDGAVIRLPETISQAELLNEIEKLNNDPNVDGILCQLPLPKHINETEIILAISPSKDVDCFHPENVGKMIIGLEGFRPCTAEGIVELLVRSGTPISGSKVCVIGRSMIVGRPVSIILGHKGYDATVTLCHSRTKDLENECAMSDILIAAIGIPNFVKSSWIKPGATVIDVGINSVSGQDGKRRICGDVDFNEAIKVAGKITPVPGGVGPMTIAILMRNTIRATKAKLI